VAVVEAALRPLLSALERQTPVVVEVDLVTPLAAPGAKVSEAARADPVL
jgi:hypothetical protein